MSCSFITGTMAYDVVEEVRPVVCPAPLATVWDEESTGAVALGTEGGVGDEPAGGGGDLDDPMSEEGEPVPGPAEGLDGEVCNYAEATDGPAPKEGKLAPGPAGGSAEGACSRAEVAGARIARGAASIPPGRQVPACTALGPMGKVEGRAPYRTQRVARR